MLHQQTNYVGPAAHFRARAASLPSDSHGRPAEAPAAFRAMSGLAISCGTIGTIEHSGAWGKIHCISEKRHARSIGNGPQRRHPALVRRHRRAIVVRSEAEVYAIIRTGLHRGSSRKGRVLQDNPLVWTDCWRNIVLPPVSWRLTSPWASDESSA